MWAAFDVMDLSDNDPIECFEFVLEVLKQTDDEWILTNLAAGPIENMMSRYPEEGLHLIEKEIPQNNKLEKILNGVWKNLMSEEIWAGLQKIRT